MLVLTIRQFLSIIFLFFLITFDKTIGIPFLSLLILSMLAKNWPGFARVGLVVAASIVISALFFLPVSLTLFFLVLIIYGWIFAGQTPSKANLIRALWIGLWAITYYFFSGAQISSWPLIFTFISMLFAWQYLEKTGYGN